MPAGSWNVQDLFAFNGDTPCVIGESARIHHKSNFLTKGDTRGYTARNKSNQWDPFLFPFQNDSDILFYNVNQGRFMFSEKCSDYAKYRVVFQGIPTDIGKTKMIPPVAREAIVGYVIERAFFTLKSRDAKYRVMWNDAKVDLYTKTSLLSLCKWDEAQSLLKRKDSKEMSDLYEYLSQLNY